MENQSNQGAQPTNGRSLVGDHSFVDTAGRRFTFTMNLWQVATVKKATGIDLMKVVEQDGQAFAELVGDWAVLLDVICTCLESQMQQQGITIQQFGEAMDETTCNDATKALMFAVIDFFQPAKAAVLRTAFAKVWNRTQDHQDRMVAKASEVVNSSQFDQMITNELPEQE